MMGRKTLLRNAAQRNLDAIEVPYRKLAHEVGVAGVASHCLNAVSTIFVILSINVSF